MGKTYKDRREQMEGKAKFRGWKAERQAARRDKRIKRGEFVGRRVERAKWGEE
jgi:hypothetical protein